MEILKLSREATVEDLYELDRKAEIVNGEIVPMTPTRFLPSRRCRGGASRWRGCGSEATAVLITGR